MNASQRAGSARHVPGAKKGTEEQKNVKRWQTIHRAFSQAPLKFNL
jgi:hypothetical protein